MSICYVSWRPLPKSVKLEEDCHMKWDLLCKCLRDIPSMINYSWVKYYCPKLKLSTEPFQNKHPDRTCRNLVKFLKTINENYLANKYWFRRIFYFYSVGHDQSDCSAFSSVTSCHSQSRASRLELWQAVGLCPPIELLSFIPSGLCQPSPGLLPQAGTFWWLSRFQPADWHLLLLSSPLITFPWSPPAQNMAGLARTGRLR